MDLAVAVAYSGERCRERERGMKKTDKAYSFIWLLLWQNIL